MRYPELKIAIVHDYLRAYGGGERVIEAFHQIWPSAPIFVATANFKGMGVFEKQIRKLPLHTSWPQFIPFFPKKTYFVSSLFALYLEVI